MIRYCPWEIRHHWSHTHTFYVRRPIFFAVFCASESQKDAVWNLNTVAQIVLSLTSMTTHGKP